MSKPTAPTFVNVPTSFSRIRTGDVLVINGDIHNQVTVRTFELCPGKAECGHINAGCYDLRFTSIQRRERGA